MAAVAVDMPFASPGLITLLARLHRDEPAVVPVTAGGLEPLHAVYHRRFLGPAEEALGLGEFGLRRLLDRLAVRLVPEHEWRRADPEGRFAMNLNRAEDLRRLS